MEIFWTSIISMHLLEHRFYCSCTGCGWTGEITPTGAVAMGHEPDH